LLLVPQDRQRPGRAAQVRLPRRQEGAGRDLGAEDKAHVLDAVTAFKTAYGAKFAKAVAKITGDLDQLLAFYGYPAEHWVHLRTTNPIESAFATEGTEARSPKGLARGRRAWRWHSSSSSQPKIGGAPSTHLTWPSPAAARTQRHMPPAPARPRPVLAVGDEHLSRHHAE
jgi:mutator family transposase